jgi:hypothetical protein
VKQIGESSKMGQFPESSDNGKNKKTKLHDFQYFYLLIINKFSF